MERSDLKVVKGSSNVRAAGWEPSTDIGDLHIVFRDDSHYIYRGVPYSVYIDFLSAPSKGKFVHMRLEPYYHTLKVEPCPHCGKGIEREARG